MEISVSFVGLLQLVFITLKLIGVIAWSWGLVLLPTLISIGLFILFIIGMIIYYSILNAIHKNKK
jgi:hypothetical protein